MLDKGSHEFYPSCYKHELKKSHVVVIPLEFPNLEFISMTLLEFYNFNKLYRHLRVAHSTSTDSQQWYNKPLGWICSTSPASRLSLAHHHADESH